MADRDGSSSDASRALGDADNDVLAQAVRRDQDQENKASSSEPVGEYHPWMDERNHGSDGNGRGRLLLRKFKRIRVICGRIVNSSPVQLFVVFLIAANAIFMGVGTLDFVTNDPVVEARFQKVDQVFLIVFTAELALQFVYHGLRLLLDRWLVFDLVIIVSSWAFKEAQIMRSFRIFRALRLITRIDTMRNLVTALFATSTAMLGIGVLLLLITYIFSVMFTQMFKSLYKNGQTEYNYFSRLDASFFTCFQLMTFDNWGDVCKEVQAVYWWAWMPIISYIIIAGFALTNLIVAVICDAMAALHENERAKITGQTVNAFKVASDGAEDDDEQEEMKEEEKGFDHDNSANHSWGGVQENRSEKGSSSKSCSVANVTMHLLEMQGEVKQTMRVQGRTLTVIEYLTQQLANVPTPHR